MTVRAQRLQREIRQLSGDRDTREGRQLYWMRWILFGSVQFVTTSVAIALVLYGPSAWFISTGFWACLEFALLRHLFAEVQARSKTDAPARSDEELQPGPTQDLRLRSRN